jgi:hypothetical protein
MPDRRQTGSSKKETGYPGKGYTGEAGIEKKVRAL